ncbi:zinc ribbon domain-containing protein [Serratia sp. JSRIV004]|nr:zinc ribbon domain-containing protein [Serratia sp. JSRIV004]
MEILIIAAFLGLIPAFIAQSKGRSFGAWWLYGFLLFIVALIHSLCLSGSKQDIENIQLDQGMVRCPLCAELIRSEAVKCKHCGSDISDQMANLHNPSFSLRDIDYTTLLVRSDNSVSLDDGVVKTLAEVMKKQSKSVYPSHIFAEYQGDVTYVKYLLPSTLQEDFVKRLKYWLGRG